MGQYRSWITGLEGQYEQLVSAGALEANIKSVVTHLQREGSKEQLRQLAGTAALFALTWYAGGVGGLAGAARGGSLAAGTRAVLWMTSGSRAVAGGISAATNVAGQALTHGVDFDKYDWPSVGVDYVLGAISQRIASGIRRQFKGTLLSAKPANWIGLGKQQIAFALYGVVVSAVRSELTNTSMTGNVQAGYIKSIVSPIKNSVLTNLLESKRGRTWFPMGEDDPRFVAVSKFFSLILNTAIQQYTGTVPSADAAASDELTLPSGEPGG